MAAIEMESVTLSYIGGNCPVQAEGTVDGQPFYFRARGEHWALHIGPEDTWFGNGDWSTEHEYGDGQYSAGWMGEDEAISFIIAGIAEYRSAQNT